MIIDFKKMSDIDINNPFFDHLKSIDKNFETWFNKNKKGYCHITQDNNKNYYAIMYMVTLHREKTIQIDLFEVSNQGKYLIPIYMEKIIYFTKINGFENVKIILPIKNKFLINQLIKNYDFLKEKNDKDYCYLIKEIEY